ncbi:hypothetical protein QJS10_CPA01g02683 [Acorus calamus]|uniref:Uncharacterized protein n=1 Tax=Acorus calamus TaxID=4465 RepID=A0AAV9FHM8_ACOCL|nr:hypothetical protein QJS10_CPA01g02683 [Acorus calamus]
MVAKTRSTVHERDVEEGRVTPDDPPPQKGKAPLGSSSQDPTPEAGRDFAKEMELMNQRFGHIEGLMLQFLKRGEKTPPPPPPEARDQPNGPLSRAQRAESDRGRF